MCTNKKRGGGFFATFFSLLAAFVCGCTQTIDYYKNQNTLLQLVGLLCLRANLIYYVVFWCNIFGDAGEPYLWFPERIL